ncbi:MAG: lipoate---protein ligase [Gaiellales bacterium]|jgi:lipoate-protein ligase A|nr:lipoate---protein ligase [Gaiellales bacterium]
MLGELDPASALAWDEAVARASLAGATLLLWRTRPAVVIGRFQRADWEIDAGACARHGVRVWRRFTGGGAVLIDPGTLCIALAWPAGHPWAAAGVPEMYRPLLDGVVRACRAQGVDAHRDERTVRVGDSKVTGIAAHRGRAGMLVHGTLLIDADLDALRECLAGPRDGDLQGHPRPAASRPDSVANVAGEGWEQAMVEAFGADLGDLDAAAESAMQTLRSQKYHDPAWHAGSWSSVTAPEVRALLGPVTSG